MGCLPFTWCDWFVSSLRRLFIIPFNRYFIYINHSRQRKEHQKGGGTSFLAHSPSLVYRASNNFPPENFVPPLPLVIVYNVNRIKSSIWLPLRKRAESQGSALFHWSELMTYDPDGSDSFCICLIYKKTAEIHVLRVYRGRDSAFFQYFPCYT